VTGFKNHCFSYSLGTHVALIYALTLRKARSRQQCLQSPQQGALHLNDEEC